MNTVNLKITTQEQNILNFCTNKQVVYWEDLAQFAKDPQNVKLKTIRKVVSEVKRKYAQANLPNPFTCEFASRLHETAIATVVNQIQPLEQVLVQVKRTAGGATVLADSNTIAAHVDFRLDKYNERVITKYGPVQLSENAYKLFALLHTNAGKFVHLQDMKDVLFDPKSPSKIPHTWAHRITGYLTDLRKALPDLKSKDRLITAPGTMNGTRFMLV